MIALKSTLCIILLALSLVPSYNGGSFILVDTGHGGYPLEVDNLSEFRDLAREHGFTVHLKPLKRVDLHKYCLVISANPDISFSQGECSLLKEYLIQGGTFFLMGSGDYKNRDHSDVCNPLLKALQSSIQLNDDQLKDTINSGESYIPLFDTWRPHPMTRNLPPISLYSPESVILGERGYPLLQGNASTVSKDTDGSILCPVQKEITLLAVERMGKGDLLVGGSAGFVSGLVFAGHEPFVEALLSYVSTERATISSYKEAFQGASIVIGKDCRPEVDVKGAEVLSRILQGHISSSGLVIIGGPQANPFLSKINQYLPIKFKKRQTWYLANNNEVFYGQQYGIIAVITADIPILVVAGLGGTGTSGAVAMLEQIEDHNLRYTYNYYGEAVLIEVTGDTNLDGINQESEHWNISIL
ncbi:MAG: hypothetical protein HXS54_03085 [Theionarchaea archaeon]|nr:hypothetical protein [Theionarchaea archaeon]